MKKIELQEDKELIAKLERAIGNIQGIVDIIEWSAIVNSNDTSSVSGEKLQIANDKSPSPSSDELFLKGESQLATKIADTISNKERLSQIYFIVKSILDDPAYTKEYIEELNKIEELSDI